MSQDFQQWSKEVIAIVGDALGTQSSTPVYPNDPQAVKVAFQHGELTATLLLAKDGSQGGGSGLLHLEFADDLLEKAKADPKKWSEYAFTFHGSTLHHFEGDKTSLEKAQIVVKPFKEGLQALDKSNLSQAVTESLMSFMG